MVIAVDIDGVIAIPNGDNKHEQCRVVEGAAEAMRFLKKAGHTLILYTARPEIDREVTVQWMHDNGIKYDSLVMDKVKADIYIDDRAVEFESWYAKALVSKILRSSAR